MITGVLQNIRGFATPERTAAEPGARLFHGLRIQLTLLHTAVLGVVLLLCGLVLYLAFLAQVMRPVNAQVTGQAEAGRRFWIENDKCTLPSGGPIRSGGDE